MKRIVCIALSAICALGLIHCAALLQRLEGLSAYRLTVPVSDTVRGDIAQISLELGLDVGAFFMSEQQGLQLYECLMYHPGALGIVLMSGSPITQAQIERGERVIMLSEQAALALDPGLDCLDRMIEIYGAAYRIVGVYRHDEPLGFFTRTSALSAIVPLLKQDEAPRRLFVWLKDHKASSFTFEQAKRGLSEMSKSPDLGAFQAANLGQQAAEQLQSIRLWFLLLLAIVGWRLVKALRGMRRRFCEDARLAIQRDYAFRAALRLVVPFAKGILPTLLVVGGWTGYLAYCANHLIVRYDRVPERLLDPEAWLGKWASFTATGNLAEQLPVHAFLLEGNLSWIIGVLGISAVAFLLFNASKVGDFDA